MYIMSRSKCKDIDAEAINSYGFSGTILMENAANSIFEEIKSTADSFLIICGNGNNGGDGLAIGRKLLLDGKKVGFILVKPKDKSTDEFNTNLQIVKSICKDLLIVNEKSELESIILYAQKYDIIIDSIFGTGLNRLLDSFYCSLISIINNLSKKIISVDVPSGLDSDTGRSLGNAIKADYTYTFEVIKKGFINYEAFKYLGKVKVISIGIPEKIKEDLNEKVYLVTDESNETQIKSRSIFGHKGDYGRSVIVAGSYGYLGAARIATEACLSSGAGLTTLITTDEGQKLLSPSIIEAMICSFDNIPKCNELISNADAVAFGPGIENSRESEELLLRIIDNAAAKIIIDAEGINILSRRPEIVSRIPRDTILTPHPGEMSRLINKPVEFVNENRIEVSKEFARKNKCIIVLKGYNTVITDGDSVYVNTSGNSKMASGGMGDALTGIITALLSQGLKPLEAAVAAVFIHGKAGEAAGEGQYSIKASQLIDNIAFIMNKVTI